jgi:hypothetical protein
MNARSKYAALMAMAVALAVSGASAQSQEQLMDKVKQLEQRVNELEGKTAEQTNYVAKADVTSSILNFIKKTEFSGYVSGSYFYHSGGGNPVNLGYITSDTMMLNKVKLALEKPIVTSGEKWDAGFAVGFIAGQDAQFINATGNGPLSLGTYGLVENATIGINVPVGNGLTVKFGKMVTMMGVEVIEETINPNWTLGNQFQWVEPFTQTGLHLEYKFNDKITTKFMVFNGWDVLPDNNGNVSYMGAVNLTLSDATSLMLLGYGGAEQTGNNDNWRYGFEAIVTQKFGEKLTAYLQLDYGHEDNAFTPDGTQTANAAWYASGLWLVYQAMEKGAIAFRADYLLDVDSTRTAGLFGGPATNPGDNDMASFTATFNWTPWKGLQIRPEVRYDLSSQDVFNGKQGQFSVGVGTAYVF